jgi:hypothetical protein
MTRKVPQTTSSGSSDPDARLPSTAMRVGAPYSKFKAVKTVLDGITFASKKEAKRYTELKLLERAGEISRLELQPRYDIIINGVKVCTYVADFSYFDKSSRVVEDVKGMKTPVYRLKKKLVEALFPGVVIKEV